MMENYGFVLLETDEAKNLGLPDGSGLFSELFNQMEYEISQFPNKKADYKQAIFMSLEEKKISFMNRYFAFKKMRNVDINKFNEMVIKKDKELNERIQEVQEELYENETDKPILKELKKDVVEEQNEPENKKKTIRKTKKKVIIN